MIRSLALKMIHSYPAAWRERYEAEMCALIEDMGVRFRDLAELAWGLIVERIRELFTSDERLGRTALARMLLDAAVAVGFVTAAYGTGRLLQPSIQPWLGVGSRLNDLLSVTVYLSFQAASHRRRKTPYPASAWMPFALISLLFVAAVLIGVLDSPSVARLGVLDRIFASRHWLYLVASACCVIELNFWLPGHQLIREFRALRIAEKQLKEKQQFVFDCRAGIARGVSAPFDEARAQFEQSVKECEAIRERVRALGYNARFRRQPLGRSLS